MARAKKLPNGKWRIRVCVTSGGQSKYKCFTGDTQKETEQMAAQYAHTQQEIFNPANMTLFAAMNEFIDNRNNILSPTTVALYRIIARTAFGSIKDLKLSSLNQTLVQKAVNEYVAGRAYKTVSNATGFLSVVLKEYAPEFQYKLHMPQKKRKTIAIPTEDDVAKLLSESRGTPLYLPILCSTQLGMRRGEICAIDWPDINLDEKTIRINESIAQDEFGALVRKKPKTVQSERVLKLTDQLIAELPAAGEKIITIAPKTITKHFAELVKRLNMKYTFHSLRHYYASIMLKIGVPDKYAMERMGHSTNNMLKTVYQHTFTSEQEVINAKLQDYFDQKT